MAPKVLLVPACVLLVSFLISATAAATAEEQITKDATAVVADQAGIPCEYGCCRWRRGFCLRCCATPEPKAAAAAGGSGIHPQQCICCTTDCSFFCCFNGQRIPAEAMAKGEPRS